jgi:MscS family membrane protein
MGLIAGLGIGGLAIALAAKDTAANLFGSAMIFMDRPFKIGDHILLDKREGIVEEIGFSFYKNSNLGRFYCKHSKFCCS